MKYLLIYIIIFSLNFEGCTIIRTKILKGSFEEQANSIFENGNNYFKAREYEKATIELKKLVNNYPGTRVYEPGLYLLAFSYYKLTDYENSIYYGRQFLKEFPNSNYTTKTLKILGEANLQLVKDYEAVYYFIKFYKSTPDTSEKRIVKEKIGTLLSKLTVSDLEKLHRTFIGEQIDEEILYNLIKAEIREGKEKEARRDFELLTRRFPETHYGGEFEDFKKVSSLGLISGRVGVLLPLSGKFSQYGMKLLEIIKFFEKNRSLPFSLVTMDTKSDPIEATIATSELIENRKVDFIIGPLFTIEALGAVGFAFARGVPVIIPTTLEARFDQISSCFMPGQTLEEQTKIVAHYSINSLHYTKFAVLQADILKYKGLGNIFINEVRRYNGEVVAVETFNPDSVTLKWELERIKKKRPEAIFLAMDTEMIINTAPQVFYYGLTGVKLLGLDFFYNEKVIRLGERYVESSIFTSPVQVDSLVAQELEKNGFNSDDFISAKFFQVLWSLRELKNYERINLIDALNNIFKKRETFNIWTIRNGEFVKLAEMSGE
uniref:Outer membrane protein assembly factor BamD n=1 Tax=candidate division WOR-3 bacterium TaxID=2052148 RepID=A0A7C4XM27_UNCW3